MTDDPDASKEALIASVADPAQRNRLREMVIVGEAEAAYLPDGDAQLFLALLDRIFGGDDAAAVVRGQARSLVHKFLPATPPELAAGELFALLGNGGRYNKWMMKRVEDSDAEGLKAWRTAIRVLGKSIHQSSGTTCLNGLLVIAEKGFKSAVRAVREETFKSWEVLIDNFAADPAVLNSQKRVRLLTRPLVVSYKPASFSQIAFSSSPSLSGQQ